MKEGGRCFRHQSRDFHAACGKDSGIAGYLLQPMKDITGKDIHMVAPRNLQTTAGRCSQKNQVNMESLDWSRLLSWTAAHTEEPIPEQVVREEPQPVGDPCWSSLFLMNCRLWEGLHSGAGRSVRIKELLHMLKCLQPPLPIPVCNLVERM